MAMRTIKPNAALLAYEYFSNPCMYSKEYKEFKAIADKFDAKMDKMTKREAIKFLESLKCAK